MATSNFGYLKDLDAQASTDLTDLIWSRLDFQFQPDGLVLKHDSGIKTIAVPGRSHGVAQFGAGGDLDESLELTFIGDDADPAFVARRVDWLLSLTLPDYDAHGNLNAAPHTVLYCIGEWKNLRCKVISFSASYGPTFDHDTRYPRIAKVQLGLRYISDLSLDFRQVRQ